MEIISKASFSGRYGGTSVSMAPGDKQNLPDAVAEQIISDGFATAVEATKLAYKQDKVAKNTKLNLGPKE